MILKSLVKPTLDSVWINYCDLALPENSRQLTHKSVVDLSEPVVKALDYIKETKKACATIVGLKFDENSEKILGHFVALVACLRSVFPSSISH
jgi:hypothetical protein